MHNNHTYYVYIMTNRNRKVLYVGVTNSLGRRVYEHEKGMIKGFTKKYNCHYLVYYELFNDIDLAINREKQIKKWGREKKDALIKSKNPGLLILNEKVRFW
ncbi:MAG: GIY-YIG nuclease family protein [Bacteroidales bacterium]|nr:GIY-YIG nuclease family protein [Bacteroidales bacterium]MCF8344888.1 GIY-YIG nuclease family protein [Bacteroidales bacterium]MCF8351497.1 GIY-YIG nuclease family protein [Bacteroidales bacterium]MCF8374722.1 GIY-YIG nuclease family protein [Bacteroidales bacterium]